MRDLPKHSPSRPDFMATGPRVVIEEGRPKLDVLRESEQLYEDEDDTVDASPMDMGTQRYYRSDKILGKLYRAINEESFFANLQKDMGPSINASRLQRSPIPRLWARVKKETADIEWKHHEGWAYGIKEL